MKFLNFGSINIDTFFRVEHIVRPGETISAKSIEKRAGGKGLNQSIALAKVSKEVYHAGNIGSDGKFLIEELKKSGVDVRFVKTSSNQTGNALIQVDDKGENSIVLFKGANFSNTKDYVDSVLANFNCGDICVLQNEINLMPYIIEKAYDKGMKLVVNPSPITDEVKKFDLGKIDLLLVNETEARSLAGVSEAEKAIDFFRKNYPKLKVLMTLGKKGSVYFDSEKIVRQDSYKVKAVDSTGAGDTFTGYFVTYFYKDYEIEKCLDIASRASALSVSKKGASISIPDYEEVLKFKGWKMKEKGILNSEISKRLSDLGHTDLIAIADCGLPIEPSKKIDLALRLGEPKFIDVLEVLIEDFGYESYILAEEIKDSNPEQEANIKKLLGDANVEYISHEDFKKKLDDVKFVIRTGEATPYSNVILQSKNIF